MVELLPPPHPSANSAPTSSNPNPIVHKIFLCVSGFRLPVPRSVPNNPRPGSRAATMETLYPLTGGVETAEMVRVDAAVLDPGEMADGLKVQLKPAGAEQEREICPLNPPAALALTIRFAEPPCATVRLWEERFSEKFGLPTAAAGTRLAKTLVVLPPAGKFGWLPPPAVR